MAKGESVARLMDEAYQAVSNPYQTYASAQSPAARFQALGDFLAEAEAYALLFADLLLPQLVGKFADTDFLDEAVEDSRVIQGFVHKMDAHRPGAPEQAEQVRVAHLLVDWQRQAIMQCLVPRLNGAQVDLARITQEWAQHRVQLREQRATADASPDPSSEGQD